MIALDRPGVPRRTPISRATDRRITFAGLAIALGFAGAAVASLALPDRIRLGTWLPMHLALAGAATTAVVSVLPFFTSALAGVPPAPAWIRAAAIGLVGGGAIVVLTARGHAADIGMLALPAGAAFVAGLGLGAVAAFAPLRSPVARRWRLLELAYAVALANVALGAGLATLQVIGQPDIATGWAHLKPAHAWLNLFGFLSLTIAATMAHLAPTIAGARIGRHGSVAIAIAALIVGPAGIAAAHVVGWDLLARAGGAVVAAGGLAVAFHGWAVHRGRAAWTSEHAWHQVTGISLLAGSTWFALAAGLAGGRSAAFGIGASGWSVSPLLAPLVVGFVGQTLVGAGSHLLPSIGPGDQRHHARQREILAWFGRTRLVTLNLGCAVSWVGALTGSSVADLVGGLLIVAALAGAIILLARAALPARTVSGAAPAPPPPTPG